MKKLLRLFALIVAFALMTIQFSPAAAGPNAPITVASPGAGLLDPVYGVGGKLFVNADPNFAGMQSDGRIIWAESFRLFRVDTAGNFDQSFANNAAPVTPRMADDWIWILDPTYEAHLTGITVLPDDSIVGVGYIYAAELLTSSVNGEDANLVLWRSNPDGWLDDTFGVRYPGMAGRRAVSRMLAQQPDGNVLIAGRSFFNECFQGCRHAESFAIDRYDGAGNGENLADDVSLANLRLMTGQDDGKLLLLIDDTIRRYQGGQLDPSFGGDGIISATVPITAMTILPDGKLLTAGSNDDFVLARYLPDGSPDPSFGSAGVSTIHLDGTDVAKAMTVQPDGRILVAGSSDGDMALIRLLPNGALDPTFGTNGLVTTDFGDDSVATQVRLLPRSKIGVLGIAAGRTVAARYLGDTCDAEFRDVPTDAYYYVPVQSLYCRGAISGYADGTFGGERNTTRAQLAKIVVLAQGLPLIQPKNARFGDVPATSPFFPYIETAAQAGIISGYVDGTFKPNNNITRGQLSKIVTLAKGWQLVIPEQPTFVDVPTDNPFYAYVETVNNKNVVSGYDLPDGGREFRWGNNATRAQVAKIVYKTITGPTSVNKAER